MHDPTPRRSFLKTAGLGLTALGVAGAAQGKEEKTIAGFDDFGKETATAKKWKPISDRKVRVGIVGYGACRFGAAFGFQDHPNVEIVAVSDLFPDRCAALAKACRCEKTYPSLEEMVKDDSIEAIFCATDAPSHARHASLVLDHGKHVASAVPACFETLEDGERLLESVKTSGKKYMMFETSSFHADCYAMRQAYMAGAFGRLVYSEGEYYHHGVMAIDSYKDWRKGLPPMWYPTHSTAYYIGVTDGSLIEVSCQGFRGNLPETQQGANAYDNPIDSEAALFKTSEEGICRIAVTWGLRGMHGEKGRVGGELGGMIGTEYDGHKKDLLPNLDRPPLPPGVHAGGHGGAHGRLTDEFLSAILADRRPLVDIYAALNMTVPGIIAHQSALRDGELLKIPQYERPNKG